MYIRDHSSKEKIFSTRIANRHVVLGMIVSLCILLSSCNAIKDVIDRAHQNKKNKNTEASISAYEQISPIKGRVISPFGYRGNHKHSGADIKLQHGDTVRAAFCGRVTKACSYSGYGNLVILKHANNIITYYGHLSKCLVEVGDSVMAGAIIGLGGRTGRASTDHLHFEVRYNNIPKNPEQFFDFASGTVRIPFIAFAAVKESNTEKAENYLAKNDSEDKENDTNFENIVTIKQGDTLYALAKRHNTTIKQLQEINNMEKPFLKIGMKLKVK
jgi:murein DD-endopeptidase MepM/ murein hydrolase activator NlpD